MRVLHFAETFSSVSETFIYDYVTELERQGVDNHVATFRRVNEEDRPFPKVHVVKRPSRWHPRRLWHRALVPFGIRQARTSDWPQIRDRLTSVVREVNPDVIHAQFGPAGVLVGPVAETLETPLIVSFHGYDVSVLARQEFWLREYEELFEQTSALHAVSSHIAERIEALGGDPEQIHVVHNGIKLDRFASTASATPGSSRSAIRCLHVGRLVEKKAPIHLVRAFGEARQRTVDIDLHLTIAGSGPLKRQAEEEAKCLDLGEAISFEGQVPHHVVPQLMASSDIYAMHCMTASDGDQEGMGVTFAEASAMGLPVVTTRHNGIPDVVIDEETGFLVAEGDVKQMGEKIALLAENEELRRKLGKHGKQHIEENFSIDRQVSKMKSLLLDLALKC
jgi:glycosyltransferase involved in cell wall biosynthesis